MFYRRPTLTDTPGSISEVCFHWRQTCLRTPQLWAPLYFVFAGSFRKTIARQVLRHVERSAEVPLTLCIEVDGSRQGTIVNYKWFRMILQPLFDQSQRWSSLSLTGSVDAIAGFLPLLHDLNLTNLITFKNLGVESVAPNGEPLNLLEFLRGRTPNLRSFTNRRDYDASWYTSVPGFKQLCHLTVSGYTSDTILEAMRACGSALESMEVIYRLYSNRVDVPTVDSLITLPSLRTLHIRYSIRQQELITDIGPHLLTIFHSLNAPSLESLTLQSKNYVRLAPIAQTSLHSSIEEFARRSNFRLRSFCLDRLPCTPEDLLRILSLKVMEEIRYLTICESAPPFMGDMEKWNFSSLVTTEVVHALSPELDGEILLPSLRELKFHVMKGWEDYAFERMVESRCRRGLVSIRVDRAIVWANLRVDMEKLTKLDLIVKVPDDM
ncbi:hypothetical protein VNI00_010827 [Paramarasmius palmivorus]|uniref:F-box domain-containing protein n=1 Tax=Paramarasmius palmivorus TaxID=297713 RepID=A0AAW0CHQ9_9AGAR